MKDDMKNFKIVNKWGEYGIWDSVFRGNSFSDIYSVDKRYNMDYNDWEGY